MTECAECGRVVIFGYASEHALTCSERNRRPYPPGSFSGSMPYANELLTVDPLSGPILDERSLRELAEHYGTDKAAHGYCEHYERHFDDLRYEPVALLEVGIHDGASLRMWRDWFPYGAIVGIDKNPSTMIEDEHRIVTLCDDASIPRPWRQFERNGARFNMIIDDGSHQAEEIVGAWTYLWPLLAPGGWYVIEDLASQFCPEFGGSTEGSVATSILFGLGDCALRAQEVAEFHAYREIAFVRKAG